jgi:hypothetical protein
VYALGLIDTEIAKMEKLPDEDEMEALKRKRMKALKKQEDEKAEWRANGHGSYEEIAEEKEFFDVTKKSDKCVIQFYRQETERCKIFDKHLKILAHKHQETKFAKINAEKCPFLTERLKIRVIPTLALIKDAKTRDFVVGFTDLGNTDEFSTEMLEWRLARSELINYSCDLVTPPDQRGKAKTTILSKKGGKTIKGGRRTGKHADDDDSSDDNDW